MYDPSIDYMGDCEYCEYIECDDLDESKDIFFADDEISGRKWQRLFLQNKLAGLINEKCDLVADYGDEREYIKENDLYSRRQKVSEYRFRITLNGEIWLSKLVKSRDEFGDECDDETDSVAVTKRSQLFMLRD